MSLVKDTLQLSVGVGNGKLKVYEKGGKHLLTLTPGNDSVQTIEHVLIADSRFTTLEGVGLQSTFKDIKQQYEIDKIVTSLNNVVVLIKDSDIYFTIDNVLTMEKSSRLENNKLARISAFLYGIISYLIFFVTRLDEGVVECI